MKTFFKHLSIQVFILLTVGVGYAAWNTLVIDGETLTATKWNDIVNKSISIDSSITSLSGTVDTLTANIGSMSFNGGNIGIGATIPTAKLHVVGAVKFVGVSGASSGYYACINASTGEITRGGSCSLSDIRLKKNIRNLDNSLEKITQIRGVDYEWKEPNRGSGVQMGVIAQEVEKIFPEMVIHNPDGFKAVNYDMFIAPIIESIKELKQENNILKEQVRILESKN